jgi:uncharacterized protein
MPYRYPRRSSHQLAVRRSRAGLGLFVGNAIPKNEFVIEYVGPLLTEKAAAEKGGKYLFAIDDKLTIDGSRRKNLARYLNHSCQPNCEAELDDKRIFFYASRTIKPGEELTYHYGKEYFTDFIKPHGCRCGNH